MIVNLVNLNLVCLYLEFDYYLKARNLELMCLHGDNLLDKNCFVVL